MTQVPVYREGATSKEIEQAKADDQQAWLSFISLGLLPMPEKQPEKEAEKEAGS